MQKQRLQSKGVGLQWLRMSIVAFLAVGCVVFAYQDSTCNVGDTEAQAPGNELHPSQQLLGYQMEQPTQHQQPPQQQPQSQQDHHQQPQQQPEQECHWPRGGRRCCGTLRTPGAAAGWRQDETDHCFPASASDHMVCCVDIQDVGNAANVHDPTVAAHNPLAEPIMRNSHPSSYSWCTCSEIICEKQLKGRVAWVGQPGRT